MCQNYQIGWVQWKKNVVGLFNLSHLVDHNFDLKHRITFSAQGSFASTSEIICFICNYAQNRATTLHAPSRDVHFPCETCSSWCVIRCFSIRVPQDLRVPPVASKGSADSNRGTEQNDSSAIRHVFYWLLVVSASTCICGPGSERPNTAGWASPDTLAGGEGPIILSPLSGLIFSGPKSAPQDRFLATSVGSVTNQNCCKGFRFKENVEKHWCNLSHHSFNHCVCVCWSDCEGVCCVIPMTTSDACAIVELPSVQS